MMRPRIITLTLNPALDRSGVVARLIPGEKLRCSRERIDPGGGGINAARLLTRLGADALAVFPMGGLTGIHLRELLEAENIACDPVVVAGATRENVNVREKASGAQYRFIFSGSVMAADELKRCCDRLLQHAKPGNTIIASGSLPPCAPDDCYAVLARAVAASGGRFVLDTSGKALAAALVPEVDLLKVNEAELAELSEAPANSRETCIAAARRLLEAGPRMLAVTRGAAGALLVTPHDAWEATAPAVTAASTVGAGDSFLAALTWAIACHKPLPDALRLAVAAGSATLEQEGTGLADPADMERLLPKVRVQVIGALPLAVAAL